MNYRFILACLMFVSSLFLIAGCANRQANPFAYDYEMVSRGDFIDSVAEFGADEKRHSRDLPKEWDRWHATQSKKAPIIKKTYVEYPADCKGKDCK